MKASDQGTHREGASAPRSSVVLGGGGLSAIGWSIGVLAALEEKGMLRLTDQDLVVGTSAGAAVAVAVLQSGTASREFDTMVRKSRRNSELSPAADLEQIFPQVVGIHERQATPGEKAAAFMRLSREASGIEPRMRRDAIATRLHAETWPDHDLVITAVGTDGQARAFTRDSGVGLLDVVTASCAVPGLWPVATIAGGDYVDGGTFSLTNAELAHAAERVVILQPMPENPAYETPARTEVFARAMVLKPSDHARTGFGANPFDPDIRGIAAVLGYEDGLAALDQWKEHA